MNSMLNWTYWLLQNYGWRLLVIIMVLILGRVIVSLAVSMVVRALSKVGTSNQSNASRNKTLHQILLATGQTILYIVVLLMILALFGIQAASLLAGVGLVGLIVGFGAQSIVKDFIAGLLMALENYYGIGDKVKIGDYSGTIERMTMRTTFLRDTSGNLVSIPNGAVNGVVNYSRIAGV